MGRVRGRHDIFLDHERSEVVAPESERDLPDLHSHGHPAGLKVRNVIEDDSREGDRAQVFVRTSLGLMRHRGSILWLQRPADESSEASGTCLNLFHPLQVLEPLGKRFSEAVHHCHGCLHALAVRELHDLEPPVGTGFLGGNDVAHALNQYLTSTARNGIESGASQLANHLDGIHSEQLAEKVYLARAEAMNVDGMVSLDVLHQVDVPLERNVWVVATLDQDLDATKSLELIDLGSDLLER